MNVGRWTRYVALLSCALIGATACGGGTSTGHRSSSTDVPNVAAPTEKAIRNYGYGPAANGSANYQPDVVPIPDGAAAIRSASADGLTWTMDRNAKNVSKLKIGSVMLATSFATGRIVALQDVGNDRIVTLAPVELTDVIRNGTVDLDTKLDPSAFTYQVVPDFPGKVSAPTSGDTDSVGATTSARVVRLPPVQLMAIPTLPDAVKQTVEVPIGDGWTVEPATQGGLLGLKINHVTSALKVSASLLFDVDNLMVHTGEKISDGKASDYDFYLTGVKGLTVNLAGGVADDVDNGKIKIEVPIAINIPIPASPATAGIPFNVKVEFSAAVETAITGDNSTVVASGQYKLDGPIGMKEGSVVAPTFSVVRSIIDSLTGITLGPSGIVVAVKMKIGAGVGTASANAGPWGAIVTSIGVTNGSSLGAPLARCKDATLDLRLEGGVSISIDDSVARVLKRVLPKKLKLGSELKLANKTVLHRSQVVPDVPICKGAIE
jgi:hypothetical protein